MAFRDWREPVRILREEQSPPTIEQRKLARRLGVEVREHEPRSVVAARVREAVADAFGGHGKLEPASPRQLLYLWDLRGDVDGLGELSWGEASAWIKHFLVVKSIRALEQFELCEGDLIEYRLARDPVFVTPDHLPTAMVFTGIVSSISASGRVNRRLGPAKFIMESCYDPERRGLWPAQVFSVVHGQRWHRIRGG